MAISPAARLTHRLAARGANLCADKPIGIPARQRAICGVFNDLPEGAHVQAPRTIEMRMRWVSASSHFWANPITNTIAMKAASMRTKSLKSRIPGLVVFGLVQVRHSSTFRQRLRNLWVGDL